MSKTRKILWILTSRKKTKKETCEIKGGGGGYQRKRGKWDISKFRRKMLKRGESVLMKLEKSIKHLATQLYTSKH